MNSDNDAVSQWYVEDGNEMVKIYNALFTLNNDNV